MKKNNVIWIIADQHRYQAMGCSGDPNVRTPNLDRLAAEGLSFNHAISGSPLCTPFRGALLTSDYPHRVASGHEEAMDKSRRTIANVFDEYGYATSYFGKWHLDGFDESKGRAAFHFIPPDRRGGFQEWCAYENNNSNWDCYVHGGDKEKGNKFLEKLKGYEADALVDRFILHLKTLNGEKPFFSVVSLQPPHMPYVAPEEYMKNHTPGKIELRQNVPNVRKVVEKAKVDLAGYYAMIENIDWNVGRIRNILDELGLSESTHIIYFSDHGDMHGSHGAFAKQSPYEESIRIPFIIGGHIPRYEHHHGIVEQVINHVDIAPTTLGLCGIDIPDWMEGCDYSGYRIKNREVKDAETSAYMQICKPLLGGAQPFRPWRGIVTNDHWKYVVLEHQPWMLYNLQDDPYEQVNLALSSICHSERQKLQKELANWIQRTNDQFCLPEF